MKIGIIGSGNIGSVIARHWVEAGHDVLVSAKHIESAARLAQTLGPHACPVVPEDAARMCDVVLLTIPLGEVPKLSKEVRDALRGKIVLDTCNPYPERDGEPAREVLRSGEGTGVWTAKQLPGARVVRAFNSVHAGIFETEARRPGDPIGVPLASDDPEALRIAEKLVRDAGFGPVVVGGLIDARRFDVGTPPYGSGASESELYTLLGISRKKAA
jgi:predicted dinucleotide-binding enzyme